MSIRERLQTNKVLGVGVGAVLIVIAAVSFAYQFWPQRKPSPGMQYYTDDDGQTWFQDSIENVAPFDHNGKTAVMAVLYSYDNGSKKFCGYLAKYTPDSKKKLEAAFADAKSKGQPLYLVAIPHDRFFIAAGTLVKSPGPSSQWVPYSDSRASQIFSVHSPDGTAVDNVQVY